MQNWCSKKRRTHDVKKHKQGRKRNNDPKGTHNQLEINPKIDVANRRPKIDVEIDVQKMIRFLEHVWPDSMPKGRIGGSHWDLKTIKIYVKIDVEK